MEFDIRVYQVSGKKCIRYIPTWVTGICGGTSYMGQSSNPSLAWNIMDVLKIYDDDENILIHYSINS